MRRINALEYIATLSYDSGAYITEGLFYGKTMFYPEHTICTDGTYLYTVERDSGDLSSKRIDKYNLSGSVDSTIIPKEAVGQYQTTPRGMGIGNSILWWCDEGDAGRRADGWNVYAYNLSGVQQSATVYADGGAGGVGDIASVHLAAVDDDGNAYIAIRYDSSATLVEVRSPLGSLQVTIDPGFDTGSFAAVSYGADGRVYIAGEISSSYVIKIYTTSGIYIDNYDSDDNYPDRDFYIRYDSRGVMHMISYAAASVDQDVLWMNPYTAALDDVMGADGTTYNLGTVTIDGNIYARSPQHSIRKWTLSSTQTTWYGYPLAGSDTGKISLGTPDAGTLVPGLIAIDLRPHYFYLRDMRAAIESVAVQYENPATSAAYTLTADVNNIFANALGGLKTDWTTPTVTHGDRIRWDHYSDIDLVLTQLEGSVLV